MAYNYPSFGYQPQQTYLPNSYNQFQPPQQPMQTFPPPQQQNNAGVSARLVTGREEAVAAQIIPDGTVWLFADLAHNVIYTKQINPQTMVADFREYRGQPIQVQPEQPTVQYAPLDAFEQLRADVEQLKAQQPQPKTRGGEAK